MYPSSTIDIVETPDWDTLRSDMVASQLKARNIRDSRVLDVMGSLPRHLFVPETARGLSYEDRALAVASGQTISQPFMVATMLEALGLDGSEKVLEIGTGTGYQAALLSRLAKEVHSVEIIPDLATEARKNLDALKIHNVHVHISDGSLGLPSHAPFDAIIVAAAAPDIPPTLTAQLAPEGRLLVPIGTRTQQILILLEKRESQWMRQTLTACTFVPLRGASGWQA